MKIEVKKIKDYQIELEFDIPAKVVEERIKNIYEKYQQKVKIDGFRKGKVPIDIIKQRFNNTIKNEAINETINEFYRTTIKEHNLSPITQGIVKDIKFTEGENLTFKISFEIIPDIKLSKYKGIEITLKPTDVTEKEIDDELAKLQASKAIYVPISTRGALPGDMLIVNFDMLYQEKGIIRKKSISNYSLVIGDPDLPKPISDGLINTFVGEIKKIKVNYPIDYKDEILKGQTVEYNFYICEIKEKKLPPIDDEFAKDIGFDSLDKLKEAIKKEIKLIKEKNNQDRIPIQIINYLIKENKFESPPSLVSAYLQPLIKSVKKEKIDPDTMKNFEEIAIWRAKREILLNKIADVENITLTEEEIKSKLLEKEENKKKSYDAIIKELKSKGTYEFVIEEFRHQKVIEFLVSFAKIKNEE